MPIERGSTRSTIVAALLILAVGAGGVALLMMAVNGRRDAAEFSATSVQTAARLITASTTYVARGPDVTSGTVAFESDSAKIGPEFADFQDCPQQPVSPNDETVVILYDPSDPSDVRLPGCLTSDTRVQVVGGVALLAFDVLLFFAIRSQRHRNRSLEVQSAT